MRRALGYLPVFLQIALCMGILVALVLLKWGNATVSEIVEVIS